jgi:hypothetical protein
MGPPAEPFSFFIGFFGRIALSQCLSILLMLLVALEMLLEMPESRLLD